MTRIASWAAPMIHSFSYVENVSYAHLLYEHRLLEAEAHPSRPILSGQSFCIADSGNPISYGDLYLALNTLSKGAARFPPLPPAPLFLLANLIEFYYVTQARFLHFLPALSGDIVNLQPSMFSLVTIHFKVDHSRAELSPDQGGLGYRPPWTTLEGVCQLVQDYVRDGGRGTEQQRTGGGISFGWQPKEPEAPEASRSGIANEVGHVSPVAGELQRRR